MSTEFLLQQQYVYNNSTYSEPSPNLHDGMPHM